MDTIREFKAGAPVSDLRYGNGVVGSIEKGSYYPVVAHFSKKRTVVYTSEGKDQTDDLRPMLYHGHDLIVEVREPKLFYVNLYWDGTGNHVHTGLLCSSEEQAKKDMLAYKKNYIKTVEIETLAPSTCSQH